MRLLVAVLVLLPILTQASGIFSIDDFGAKPDDSSVATAQNNVLAIEKAFAHANTSAALSSSSPSANNAVVLVPAGKTYYIFGVKVTDVHSVTLQVEGTLMLSKNISAWPQLRGEPFVNGVSIYSCSNVTVTGNGLIDGQGYDWWWAIILSKIPGHTRPNLLDMGQCVDVVVENVRMRNSPRYHANLREMKNVIVRGLDIYVDVEAQRDMLVQHGHWSHSLSLPTFPLNTDGVDPSGINFHIYNLTIVNYDDAIAVKPVHGGSMFSNCSQDMLIEDLDVTWSVGVSIGSVPPHKDVNCIRNIYSRNIRMTTPFKAIYIKPNPGDVGTGIIQNITYENFYAYRPVWWSIYIGTQQQKQPDNGADTHCSFLYPFFGKCAANPRITVQDVKLINVTMDSPVLFPGIMKCNESNPCTGFDFQGVNVTGWAGETGYVCENIQDSTATDSRPTPSCFSDAKLPQQPQAFPTLEHLLQSSEAMRNIKRKLQDEYPFMR